MKFKTSLKCAGCVAAVESGLNQKLGEGNWSVDLNQAVKYLEVKEGVELSELQALFEEKGYSIKAS